jgi:hypothetical protein
MAVEYAPGVLDEIRATVTGGFDRPAEGAVETGGVLFGTHSPRLVTVTAMRLAYCGYASGSAFVLGSADHSDFENTLALHRSDPALAGLEPVGWFVSHLSDSLVLRPSDKAIIGRYFPQDWQLTLVIRPGRIGSLRAATIGRGDELSEDTVLNEFTIKQVRDPDLDPRDEASGPSVAPGPPMPAEQPVAAAPFHVVRERRRSFVPPGLASGSQPAPETPPPRPEQQTPATRFRMTRERTRPADPPPKTPISRPPAPTAPPHPQPAFAPWRSLLRWRIAWIIAATVLATGAAAIVFSSGRSPNNIGLQAFERDGIMQIEWNGQAAAVTHASSGKLEIRDGDVTTVKELSKDDLKRGAFFTMRKHLDLTARLRLFNASGQTKEEMTQYAGRALASRDPLLRTLEELRAENSELRRELSRQRQRADDLERRQKTQKNSRKARKRQTP